MYVQIESRFCLIFLTSCIWFQWLYRQFSPGMQTEIHMGLVTIGSLVGLKICWDNDMQVKQEEVKKLFPITLEWDCFTESSVNPKCFWNDFSQKSEFHLGEQSDFLPIFSCFNKQNLAAFPLLLGLCLIRGTKLWKVQTSRTEGRTVSLEWHTRLSWEWWNVPIHWWWWKAWRDFKVQISSSDGWTLLYSNMCGF